MRWYVSTLLVVSFTFLLFTGIFGFSAIFLNQWQLDPTQLGLQSNIYQSAAIWCVIICVSLLVIAVLIEDISKDNAPIGCVQRNDKEEKQ